MSEAPYRIRETKLMGEIPGCVIVAEIIGQGDLNGMIIGFKKFSLVANQFIVEWSPIAVPNALVPHADEIMSGSGKTYKRIRKEIDRAVSLLIAVCTQEMKDELDSSRN